MNGVEWADPAYYLCIDPGETSGWATFKEDGSGDKFGEVRGREAIYSLLTKVQPRTLIVEDFELFPWKSRDQAFSKFETVRVIGAIEFWAYVKGVSLILQMPNIKSIAYMWAGVQKAGSHKDSHERDAYVHGVYYLQKAGIRQPQQGRVK